MNCENELRELFSNTNINLLERMKIVEAQFEIQGTDLPSFDKVEYFLSNIPLRDVGKLTFTDESDNNIRITRLQSCNETDYNVFCSEGSEDTIRVRFEITKELSDGHFSVYKYERFIEDLQSLTLQEIMSAFSLLLSNHNQILFEVFDKELFFATSTMMFASGSVKSSRDALNREERLQHCRDVSFFYNTNEYSLLPDDFHFEIKMPEDPLSELFEKIETVLSLIYIASSSHIENNQLHLQITGQRSLEFNYCLDNIVYNPELFKIYYWIFTDGNVVDKAAIARNILCLHCKFSELREIDEKTFSSIQSNFNLYLKNNVNQYLELKNKVADYITEIVSKTGEYTTALLGKFKANLVATFGFLFTVILTNIVSEQPLENIFTREITIIFDIVLLGSLIYMIISVFEVCYQRKKMETSYNNLKNNYVDIFSEDEIKSIFGQDKMFEDAQKSVKRGIIGFSILWLIFIVAAFFVIENLSQAPILIK